VADDDPIDPLAGGRYCLQGRVVTMDDAGIVHDDGVVHIESGRIADVGPGRRPARRLADASITHRGTMYPASSSCTTTLSYNVSPVDAGHVREPRQWAGLATTTAPP
jgi:hypothetical protein